MADMKVTSNEEGRLRLAVQKSGRLSDDTFELLRQCGLKVSQSRTRLYARIEELPIDLLLVRDDDIPELVASGASDLGIVGGNVFEEERLDRTTPLEAEVLMSLGFSKCRLCIALPKSKNYGSAIIVSLVVAFLGATVGFLLKILTLGILAIGLFSLVLDAILLLMADWFLDDFEVRNFWWALALAAIVAVVEMVLKGVIS